ncbi:MAG: hypothetical protein AB1899_06380 [Pseudomonadota bacterium]
MIRPLVVIATPCFGGLLTQNYMLSVTRLMTSVGGQIDLQLMLLGHDALITRSRATLVAKFLDNSAATHLMFIDSDIGFEAEQFARLFRQDKDVCAAMYPIKELDWLRLPGRQARGESLASAGLNFVGTLCTDAQLRIEGEFATARYAGAGFLLIKRHVLEQLILAHPELKFQAIHAQDPEAPGMAHRYALFDPIIDRETGDYLSEDYAFCQRWRDLGGEIWLDLKSRLCHVGSNEYRGDSSLRYQSLGTDRN